VTKYLRCFPAVASQRNFSPDELILMLDFVLERKEGRGRPAAELSAQLKALPSNADVVHETDFRSVTGLGTSLGHMTEVDAGRGDWPAGHEYSNRPTLRPHFKAVWRQICAYESQIVEVRDSCADLSERDDVVALDEASAVLSVSSQEIKAADLATAPSCFFRWTAAALRSWRRWSAKKVLPSMKPSSMSGCSTSFAAEGALMMAATRAHRAACSVPNCHQMLHRGAPPPSVRELREFLR